jgi:hypothetical protein
MNQLLKYGGLVDMCAVGPNIQGFWILNTKNFTFCKVLRMNND